jgi:hypothetical protein
MKNQFLKILTLSLIFMIPMVLLAQEKTEKPVAEPVLSTFEHSFLMNNNTTEVHGKKSLDVAIQHRFGLADQPHDLYGFYAPSNIRLYLGYGITKNFAVGFGATKANENYDLSWKYAILKQQTYGMPVNVTYFGNVAMSGVLETKLYNQANQALMANRLSYYNEIMVSRKFNSHLSLQVGVNYSYFNMLDSGSFYGHKDYVGMTHGFLGVAAAGRYKFSPQSSILFEFNMPLGVSDIPKATRPMSNIGIGYEVSTGNHQFQIFICNTNAILPQVARVYNVNDNSNFKVPAWLIGFNITRQWGFNK